MRAMIYTRASLDRTGEGKSNARQEDECKRLIDFKRWEHVGTEADVSISAYTEKERPAWLRVLAAIESGDIDVVVAFHLDRLTRNMGDLERLIVLCDKHNVSIATATGDIDLTNDTGRMVARILAAVARQEVERKAARQRLAHTQRRAEGRPWTAVKMLGYTRTGEIIDEEADAIRAAIDAVLNEDVSLAEIGRRWGEAGLTSPYKEDGTPWSSRGVKQVLVNPRIAGYVTHDGTVLGKGDWVPIIDETTATLVTAKLNAPSRTNGKSRQLGRAAENLLTGIATCSVCGGSLRAAVKRGREVYVCGAWHVTVPRSEADALVRRHFIAVVRTVLPGSVLPFKGGGEDQHSIEADIERLRDRQVAIARSFAQGVTPEDAYEAAAIDIGEQIAALEGRLSGAARETNLRRLMSDAVAEFSDGDLGVQRRALEGLAVVKVGPAKGHRIDAAQQVTLHVRQTLGETEKLILAYEPMP